MASVPQTQALIAGAAAEFSDLGGRLDILVCNAAVCVPKPLAQIDEPDFDRHFATNVKAVLFGAQAAAQAFGNNGGVILIIGSVNGKRPAPGASVYSGTKAAVEAITIALASELGPRGIRINTIAPGLTSTDMANTFYKPEDMANFAAATALRRIGTPEDIAKAAAFLVSDAAAWITGDVITASGGLFF
jgi:3-oxoacyl-[acyl-carrier protein] reductase